MVKEYDEQRKTDPGGVCAFLHGPDKLWSTLCCAHSVLEMNGPVVLGVE